LGIKEPEDQLFRLLGLANAMAILVTQPSA